MSIKSTANHTWMIPWWSHGCRSGEKLLQKPRKYTGFMLHYWTEIQYLSSEYDLSFSLSIWKSVQTTNLFSLPTLFLLVLRWGQLYAHGWRSKGWTVHVGFSMFFILIKFFILIRIYHRFKHLNKQKCASMKIWRHTIYIQYSLLNTLTGFLLSSQSSCYKKRQIFMDFARFWYVDVFCIKSKYCSAWRTSITFDIQIY